MRILVWHRRDLRLEDHTALAQAGRRTSEVVPVFIADAGALPLPGISAAQGSLVWEAVRELATNYGRIGGHLMIRQGDAATELARILHETQADAVFFNRAYEPDARVRDEEVTAALTQRGAEVRSYPDAVVCEPAEIRTQQGTPYTVFTPYKKQWLRREPASPQASGNGYEKTQASV